MSRTFLTLGAAVAVALSASPADAQQPRIENAQLTTRPAGDLRAAFAAAAGAATGPAWIGYAVPAVNGERTGCCSDNGSSSGVDIGNASGCCAACRLEPSNSGSSAAPSAQSAIQAGPVRLEDAELMTVLFRVVNREVERIRIYSAECQLDAGGRPVTWLSGVRPADSIALLESMVAAGPASGKDRITDGAISALALHGDPAADAALQRLVATGMPASIRVKVPFWLGHARGAPGLSMLQRLITDDPLPEVRKKAVFGISRSREAGAVDLLIQQARTHADPGIRGEAIFWLGQKAGSKAAAAITERIEQDPETEVKKRAVFALSQLPSDDGVPRLLQLARTHSNPAVRKQAIFWLGQSKDPRALDFFAEVLK